MKDYVNQMTPSGIRRFTALAAQTPDCVSLTIGEPDLDTPLPVRRALEASLAAGRTHYAPNGGTDALRQAVARFETRRGLPCGPENVLITPGATGALFTAMSCILNPGDEVIIPTPAFSLYESIAVANGARPVFLDLTQTEYQIDPQRLERAVSPKTRAIVINSPCNPTGTVLNDASMEAVARTAKAHGLYVLCDNVYMGLSEPGIPDLSRGYGLGEQAIVCQSFSKPYAMTGWRIGYVIAGEAWIRRFTLLQAAQLASVPTFIQDAAVVALETELAPVRELFRRRREMVAQRLQEMGLSIPPAQGAFYLFPEISRFGLSSEDFCLNMIEQVGLAAVPGSAFRGEGHIRLSCCYNDEVLKEGLNRLERFLLSR